jgi:sugar phosphate isomerase/epimerase
MRRRDFLRSVAALPAAAVSSLACWRLPAKPPDLHAAQARPFKIALNQWSLWNSYVGDTSAADWWDVFMRTLRSDPAAILKGPLDPMDFPRLTRETYGLDAIEIEASLYFAHVHDHATIRKLKQRCDEAGVKCLLVSNVWGGNLGAIDGRKPKEIAQNYYPWVDVAALLGCHSLMVDVNGRRGDKNAVKGAAVEGLSALAAHAAQSGICIIAENHGWYSSDAGWLVDIIRTVNSPFCKLNVDLANFCRTWRNSACIDQQFDPYEGVRLMMPYAKAVSAKTITFDGRGNDTRTDYVRMLRIIRDSGYRGYLGVEYAGEQFSGDKGIRMTIDLINRAAVQLGS